MTLHQIVRLLRENWLAKEKYLCRLIHEDVNCASRVSRSMFTNWTLVTVLEYKYLSRMKYTYI